MKVSHNKVMVSLWIVFAITAVILAYFLFIDSDTRLPALGGDKTALQEDAENSHVISTEKGVDTAPSVDTSRDCSNGTPDDYLHPERFINPDGTLKCADGVVIFDHQIAPKFRRTIIPYIAEETGVTIDLHNIDFYLTLPETGETVVYKDIFYWYEDGNRTIFNTNKLLWEEWREYIGNNSRYTFNVSMIHEPTGTDVSVIFKDHTTITLRFDGLE